jgi:hypothetical protein
MLARDCTSSPARRRCGLLALLGLAAALALAAPPFACAGPKPCERNSDCDHAYCYNGECKKDCILADLDCPPGFVCNEISRCVPPAGWDGGVPDGAAGQGGSAGAPQGGSGGNPQGGSGGSPQGGSGGDPQGGSGGTQTGGSGGGPAGSGGSPSGSKEFDLCGSDGDCSSGLICRPMNVNGTKRCTRSCSGFGQCMTGTRCSKVPPGSETYCAFDDDGASCSGTGQCADTCVSGPGANYCTSVCNGGTDCPAGWGCSAPIQGTRVCLRLDVDCVGPSDCAGGACDPSLIVSSCSMPCSSPADCPQRGGSLEPWKCGGGYCLRPSDVFGPVSKTQNTQWACNGSGVPVNVCADGLTGDNAPNLTCNETQTVGTSGLCVSSCRFSGGCGYGFACVGGMAEINGTPTPICLASGYGEVGQGCSKSQDCLFGLCAGGKCSRDCSQDGVCPKGFSCSGGRCL